MSVNVFCLEFKMVHSTKYLQLQVLRTSKFVFISFTDFPAFSWDYACQIRSSTKTIKSFVIPIRESVYLFLQLCESVASSALSGDTVR